MLDFWTQVSKRKAQENSYWKVMSVAVKVKDSEFQATLSYIARPCFKVRKRGEG